ncbi:MAG: TilS substrate-binding domain-containing protein, partial [Microcoleaceae cyanobacterium]
EILQAEVDLLNTITQEWQAKILVVPPIPLPANNCQYLDRVILRQAPLAIQRRLIHSVLQNILASPPNFHHVEKIIYLITARNKSQTDPLPGGAIARVRHPWIEIILP